MANNNYMVQILDILQQSPSLTAHEVLQALNAVRGGEGIPSLSTIRRYLAQGVKDGKLVSQTVGATKFFSVNKEAVTHMAAHGFEAKDFKHPSIAKAVFDELGGHPHDDLPADLVPWTPQSEVPLRGVKALQKHGPAHGRKVQVRQKPRKQHRGLGNNGHSGQRITGVNRAFWFRLPRSIRIQCS